jgi:hypothetical protein
MKYTILAFYLPVLFPNILDITPKVVPHTLMCQKVEPRWFASFWNLASPSGWNVLCVHEQFLNNACALKNAATVSWYSWYHQTPLHQILSTCWSKMQLHPISARRATIQNNNPHSCASLWLLHCPSISMDTTHHFSFAPTGIILASIFWIRRMVWIRWTVAIRFLNTYCFLRK